MKRFFSFLLLMVVAALAFGGIKPDGNGDWQFRSPKTSDIVKSGELFVLVDVDTSLDIVPSSVQVFLDEVMVTTEVKVENHQVSFLYLFPLKKGKHSLELKGKTKKFGWLGGILTEFTVGIPSSGVVDDYGAVLKMPVSKYGIIGSLNVDTRITSVTGGGAALRQVSPGTAAFDLNATARAGKVYFPIRMYATSDEYNYERGPQSRNAFMVGMQSRHLELYAGDMNPVFDKLVLTGSRVTGLSATVLLRRMSLQVLNGYVNRSVEGQVFHYNSEDGFIPPNLQPDSTYSVPGIYRRNITAARLMFGSREEGSSLSFMALKGKDVESSIRYGAAPKENLVLGVENSFVTTNNKLRFSAGASFSLFTDDISKKRVTKEDLDSAFKTDVPFDPERYRNIFTLNSSTILPGKSSAAYYADLVIRGKISSTSVNYRCIGAAYRSFGNPFARTDMMVAGIREQLFFWKRRILLNGQYQHQANNLSNNQFTTIKSDLINGGFVLSPGNNIPSLNLSYSTIGRKSVENTSPGLKPKYLGTDDNTHSITAGMNYDIIKEKFIHHITLQGIFSNRVDKLRTTNSNDIRNYVAGFGEQIKPLHISIDLQANRALYMFPTGAKPMYDYYSGSLGYEIPKYKLRIGAAGGATKFFETDFSTPSTRAVYSLNASTDMVKDFIFSIEAGASPFRDLITLTNNYDEKYFYARLTYNFNRE